MSQTLPARSAASFRYTVLLLGLGCVLLLSPPVAVAQSTDADPPAEMSKEEASRKAQEERIQEYLRKREERRIQKERSKLELEAAAAAAAGAAAIESTRTDEVIVDAESTKKKKKNQDAEYVLPKELMLAQATVRRSHLGQEPTVAAYLELVESFEASPHQLAAFGSFLAEHGLLQEAIVYYDVALGIENQDPVLWLNLGTLFRQAGQYNESISAYVEALSLDGNNAMAHYNLGAVLDAKGKYDSAIDEYKLALQLDPTLADPAVNPQAASNQRLRTVKLMLYQESRLGMPLVEVPGGALEEPSSDDPER
jgi:tetratricopeptide (TPR) repeat protein